MSSFEPSRMPAWLAPVCEERSVSHSIIRCVPSAIQRAICGALPSRIARWSTGFDSPSISRKMIPGASVEICSPDLRASRCVTRSVYSSSSFVPATIESAVVNAEASSAVSSAQPNESTRIAPSVSASAAISISASATRTSRKVVAIVNGRRIAASTGGTIALSTAITAITSSAPKKLSTSTCGTM